MASRKISKFCNGCAKIKEKFPFTKFSGDKKVSRIKLDIGETQKGGRHWPARNPGEREIYIFKGREFLREKCGFSQP